MIYKPLCKFNSGASAGWLTTALYNTGSTHIQRILGHIIVSISDQSGPVAAVYGPFFATSIPVCANQSTGRQIYLPTAYFSKFYRGRVTFGNCG